MARKEIKTSNETVVHPAKVKIEDLVKAVYSQAVMIIPTRHAKKRLEDREVTMQEVRQVLSRSGSRKASKDQFCQYDSAGNEIKSLVLCFCRTHNGQTKATRLCLSRGESRSKSFDCNCA